MSRTVTIYQVYSSEDPAGTDGFIPTFEKVRAYVRRTYGVPGSWLFFGEGEDVCQIELENSSTLYVQRRIIPLTGEGMSDALNLYPNR